MLIFITIKIGKETSIVVQLSSAKQVQPTDDEY